MNTQTNAQTFDVFSGAQVTSGLTPLGLSAFNLEKRFSFIRPFDPRQALPMEGFRNAIIRYWTPKGGKERGIAAKPAKMVTIPQLVLPDSYILPEVAEKILIGLLEDQQDIMIKGMIDNDVKLIEWESVSLDSCFAAISSVRVSKRLNADMIENWAKIALVQGIEKRVNEIAAANNITSPDILKIQMAKTINAYIDNFKKLAAPVPKLDNTVCEMLLTMLNQYCGIVDDISNALREKINCILNPVNPEIGDL